MPFILGLFKSPKMLLSLGLIIVLGIMGLALRHYYIKNDENQKHIATLAEQLRVMENEIKTVHITQNVTNEIITDVIKSKEEQDQSVRKIKTNLEKQIQSIKGNVTQLPTIEVVGDYNKNLSKARMDAIWDLYCSIDICEKP